MAHLKSYTYVCEICHAEFSGPDEEETRRNASDCETQPVKWQHTFQAGDIVYVATHDEEGDRRAEKFTISGLGFAKKTHEPFYRLGPREEVRYDLFWVVNSFSVGESIDARNVWMFIEGRRPIGESAKG